MNLLSIKIKIADREYPMKVKPEDEERVRKSGKLINEKIRSYRQQFGIDDIQDLLAMVAFDSLVEKLESDENSHSGDEMASNKIAELNDLLSKSLQ